MTMSDMLQLAVLSAMAPLFYSVQASGRPFPCTRLPLKYNCVQNPIVQCSLWSQNKTSAIAGMAAHDAQVLMSLWSKLRSLLIAFFLSNLENATVTLHVNVTYCRKLDSLRYSFVADSIGLT